MPFGTSTSIAACHRIVAFTLCVVFAGFVGSPRVAAAADGDLAAALARPLSPGAVAMLAPHAAEPAAQKRLIEAIRHRDPAVRAVAARVAFVTMSKGAAPALITAVAKEPHIRTGAEQIRALMALYGAPGDSIVVSAVKRLGAPAALAMAESLARTRPADIARHLPTMAAAMVKPDLSELGAALSTAAIQHPTHASDIATAVMAAKDYDLWLAFMGAQRLRAHRIPYAAWLPALSSADESYRVTMMWHLFATQRPDVPIPPDVMAAIAPQPIAAGTVAADLTWEAFARELLARRRGAAATNVDWAGMLALPVHKEHIARVEHHAYAYLTDAEVKAIDRVDGDDHEAGKMRREMRDEEQEARKRASATPPPTVRTLPAFAKGLLADLMAIHGCKPPRTPWFAATDVTYSPDGRTRSLSTLSALLSKECQAFVYSAVTLLIASLDTPVVPDLADAVIVLFDTDFLACADDAFAASRASGPELAMTWPKVVRRPRAQYPASLMRSQLPPAEVLMRVWVSHTGCISGAETLRGVLPAFDIEAIRAIAASKMSPLTVDGAPVDTTITYHVNFEKR